MPKHIVSVGGGLTSPIELPLAVLKKYNPDDIAFVMAVLKGEHPDTWRMVQQLEEMTGKQVIKVAYVGKQYRTHDKEYYRTDMPENEWYDIWDLFFEEKFMGSSMFDACSKSLKRDTLRRWMRDNANEGDYMHVGITYDERHRLNSIVANWARYDIRVKADLVQSSRNDTRSKIERAQELLGWIPDLYALGFNHNNCGGFCVKAGKSHMARLLWYYPEIYKYHEENELKFREMYGEKYTMLRETIDGVRRGITLRELRERFELQWAGRMFPPFEDFDTMQDYACNMCSAIA